MSVTDIMFFQGAEEFTFVECFAESVWFADFDGEVVGWAVWGGGVCEGGPDGGVEFGTDYGAVYAGGMGDGGCGEGAGSVDYGVFAVTEGKWGVHYRRHMLLY